MTSLPHSENVAIADLIDGLRRRTRALRRSFHLLECAKVIETDAGPEREKLELRLQRTRSPKGPVFRLHMWEDRWIWVDFREAAPKGWKWCWTTEGRLSGVKRGSDLIEAIERSAKLIYAAEGAPQQALDELWRPLLLTGPSPLPSAA